MKIKHYLPVIIAAACFLALYHDVIFKLIQDWQNNPDYSHGFFVPLITAYLIWYKREEFAEIPIKPSNFGIILILLSLLFYIVAFTGAELFTMRFSMILVILSTIVFLAGWTYLKKLLLPILYLTFMIPLPAIIWNKIAFPLKLFATKIAVRVIQLIGITVYGEGNVIHLPNTTLEVVDACSGLRSLTSLLALSAAFALISEHSRINKCILFLSAVPIAIATNILRLTVTAALSQRYGAEVTEGFLHESMGIMVFVVALVLLFLLHKLMLKFEKAGTLGSEDAGKP